MNVTSGVGRFSALAEGHMFTRVVAQCRRITFRAVAVCGIFESQTTTYQLRPSYFTVEKVHLTDQSDEAQLLILIERQHKTQHFS